MSGEGAPAREAAIAASWDSNAAAWVDAVRAGRIESRRRVTDAAVVEALRARGPGRVLDVGCGEGWLCRALAGAGIEAVGIDASAPLVDAARAAGGGEFHLLGYDAFAAEPGRFGAFDAVACNFALLGQDVVVLLAACRAAVLDAGATEGNAGAVIVQTVHPWTACGDGPYADGWRVERFEGFGGFASPMPWYYRTLDSWLAALRAADLAVEHVGEPLDPVTGRPASLLLVAEPRAPTGAIRARGRVRRARRDTNDRA